MRLALTTAMLAMSIFAGASGQTIDCYTNFQTYCNDPYSTTGLASCCYIVTKFYRSDRSCLCKISSNANLSNEDLVKLVKGCDDSISVSGKDVCSSGSPNNVDSPSKPKLPGSPNNVDSPSESKLSTGTLVGIIFGVLAFVFAVIFVCALLLRRRNLPPAAQQEMAGYPQQPVPVQQQHVPGNPQQPIQQHVPGYDQQPPPKTQYYGMPQVPIEQIKILGASCTIFTYEELMKASNGFSIQNEIGRGGFGVVYGGTLVDGTQVAIKQLKAGSFVEIEDFKNEVETISRVHHNNLVSLVGYCSTKDNKLLVLELVPNGTLESHLHKGHTMDWSMRMKVALGSAKGLAYLHEDCHPQIVHRDIKAANILLDSHFVPKVADFGLAKKVDCHTVRIVGSPGYIDPEYRLGEQPTAKSDVYSFGVILLELITGRKPIDNYANNKTLVDWARPLLSQALISDNFDAIVDGRLGNNYNHEEMIRIIFCSASCIRRSADDRPSMSRVAHILEGIVPIEELKRDFLQRNQSFSNSSESFGNESSYQTNAGTGNINGSRVRSGNNISGSFAGSNGDYNDQNPFPYQAGTGR